MTCVFCAKFDNEPSANDVMSFEPLNPVVPGHRLFIAREHSKDAGDNPWISALLFREAAKYIQDLPAANIITSKGEAATQSIFHTHIHVIPRKEADGLKLPWSDIPENKFNTIQTRTVTDEQLNNPSKGLRLQDSSKTPEFEGIKEQLAAIEHERWADWQRWMHSLGTIHENKLGKYWSIPIERIDSWEKQAATPYHNLSEREKASDMEQVDRYWPLIEAYIKERIE